MSGLRLRRRTPSAIRLRVTVLFGWRQSFPGADRLESYARLGGRGLARRRVGSARMLDSNQSRNALCRRPAPCNRAARRPAICTASRLARSDQAASVRVMLGEPAWPARRPCARRPPWTVASNNALPRRLRLRVGSDQDIVVFLWQNLPVWRRLSARAAVALSCTAFASARAFSVVAAALFYDGRYRAPEEALQQPYQDGRR